MNIQQNNDILYYTFRFISDLIYNNSNGQNDFVLFLKLFAYIGLLFFLISIAFRKTHFNLKWIIGLVIVLFVFMKIKIDITFDTNKKVPVPVAIALPTMVLMETSSYFEDKINQFFAKEKKVNTSVDNFSYGFFYRTFSLKKMMEFKNSSSQLNNNLNSFWEKCVFEEFKVDINFLNNLLLEDNLKLRLKEKFQKSHYYFVYNNKLTNCEEFTSIINDLTQEVQNIKKEVNQDALTFSKDNFAHQKNIDLNDFIIQNILINHFKQFSTNLNKDNFRIEKIAKNKINSFMSDERMIDFFSLFIDISSAMVLLFFPILIALILLPSGFVIFINYIQIMLWITLWRPLYTLLHHIMLMHCDMLLKQESVNLKNHGNILHIINDSIIISVLFGLFVPILAWLLIHVFKKILSSLENIEKNSNHVNNSVDNHQYTTQPVVVYKYETSSVLQKNDNFYQKQSKYSTHNL